LLFIGNLVVFTVNEVQQVVVTQFGEPIRVIKAPGLYFKLPNPIQRITVFDDRLLDYDANPEDIYTKDKKILVLDNYARWRIVDPLLFLQTLRTTAEGLARLDDIIYSEMRKELGQHELTEVIATNREELMRLVTQRSDEAAQVYGIKVLDVRIKRADLPPENEAAVFNRMRAERDREAKGYRAEGQEEALKIRAETDLAATRINAEAYEKSQGIRGQGDAEALRIYAEAYKDAARFYKFVRTLEAYEKSLDDKTVLVLPSDSEFLKYLQGSR
jgi:membrane protease subunit HflC